MLHSSIAAHEGGIRQQALHFLHIPYSSAKCKSVGYRAGESIRFLSTCFITLAPAQWRALCRCVQD